MTEPQATMAFCPHCDQPVDLSRHSTAECRNNLRRERDKSRNAGRQLYRLMLATDWVVTDNEAAQLQVIVAQNDWLEQQPTVDEKGEGAVP